ncbi:M28 family peptidase [uncultured Paraglaciecola sp.]|uniref:M28 family peptidase n=1 Tax=uncultured Paraglaciecola sp. TaxID=1765024 RepID=UPI00261A7971|nr:M28 family peptidase [uncultured Paraglaciecola sp.]
MIKDLSILSSVDMAGRKTGSVGNFKAKTFIQSRFQEVGLTHFTEYPEYIQKFAYPKPSSGSQGINIVGWVKGGNFAHQFIVVTAHYDHLGATARHVYYGADDNASGVAALLAIAEKVTEVDLSHSVIFLATDAEEKGLHGAKAFVSHLPIDKHAITLNINLDMLGEGGRRNRLYATFSRGKKQLFHLVNNVAEISGLCLLVDHRKSQRFNRFGKHVNWRKASDHAAFSKVGIPYLFLGGGIHKRYHTPKDSFENINQRFFLSAAETAWLILQAADKGIIPIHPNN